jgi:hypothetical protein
LVAVDTTPNHHDHQPGVRPVSPPGREAIVRVLILTRDPVADLIGGLVVAALTRTCRGVDPERS